MADPVNVMAQPSASTVPLNKLPFFVNLPAPLKSIATVSTAMSVSDDAQTITSKAHELKSLIASLPEPSADGAITERPFVQRRGEVIGTKKMTEVERVAYTTWKAGGINPPQISDWPLGSAGNANVSQTSETPRRFESMPRWTNLATDLGTLYGKQPDITAADARKWERKLATEELKNLAIALRKVRKSTLRVAERVEKRQQDTDGAASSGANRRLQRAARQQLRVLRMTGSKMRELKGSLGPANGELKGVLSSVQRESLGHRMMLRKIVGEEVAVKATDSGVTIGGESGVCGGGTRIPKNSEDK